MLSDGVAVTARRQVLDNFALRTAKDMPRAGKSDSLDDSLGL